MVLEISKFSYSFLEKRKLSDNSLFINNSFITESLSLNLFKISFLDNVSTSFNVYLLKFKYH